MIRWVNTSDHNMGQYQPQYWQVRYCVISVWLSLKVKVGQVNHYILHHRDRHIHHSNIAFPIAKSVLQRYFVKYHLPLSRWWWCIVIWFMGTAMNSLNDRFMGEQETVMLGISLFPDNTKNLKLSRITFGKHKTVCFFKWTTTDYKDQSAAVHRLQVKIQQYFIIWISNSKAAESARSSTIPKFNRINLCTHFAHEIKHTLKQNHLYIKQWSEKLAGRGSNHLWLPIFYYTAE